MRKLIAIGLAVLGAASVVAIASAQDGGSYPTDNDVNEIAKQLYCPVCPNTPLDVCESKACQDWRSQIRDQLAAGWSQDQIISYFVDQYGERVLAEPRRSGFTSMVWVLPVVGVGLGLGILGYILQKWRTKTEPTDVEPEVDDEIPVDALEVIQRDLTRLD